jgi:hypothetical protein
MLIEKSHVEDFDPENNLDDLDDPVASKQYNKTEKSSANGFTGFSLFFSIAGRKKID